jgi:saccharopine dehydrogenase-like NADP-dependent oxidoreductase
MTRLAVVGRGVVGQRISRRIPTLLPGATILDHDPRAGRPLPADVAVVVLAHGGPHADVARTMIERGVAVVSVSDDLDDVRALLDLDDAARNAGVALVVGAGMAPGLTELLARMLVSQLSDFDEIHLAVHGTAGPACARRHHRALRGRAVGFHDGTWIQRPAGSGRELSFFPEPVGPYDCYRAELASPLLVYESFPGVERISARVSANRRDRLTAWLPMLSPPHREGGVGAVRVEVRGTDDTGARVTSIVGVAELVGTATAATAAAFTAEAVDNRLPTGVSRAGDEHLDTIGLLAKVGQLGVRLQEFTGVPSAQRISANP